MVSPQQLLWSDIQQYLMGFDCRTGNWLSGKSEPKDKEEHKNLMVPIWWLPNKWEGSAQDLADELQVNCNNNWGF